MILHQCTKNYDNMFGCRAMDPQGKSFWATFCPFTYLGGLKIKTFKTF